MRNATHTKRGRVTAYGFGCGYVERKGKLVQTELYMEHGTYHVRQFDRRPGATEFRVFWESFPRSELANARARYNRESGDA